MRYNNYHKHTHVSNIFTVDSNAKVKDYCERAVQLGHTAYFTTEHGTFGDIFEAKTLCDQYGLKCIAAVEAYIVPDNDPALKDNSNYHIMIIPRNNGARREMNYLLSMANMKGFYYKPRLSTADLLTLNKDDLYITTACMAGILKDEKSIEQIFLPLYNHFKENIFLEIQDHNNPDQININKRAAAFARELGLRLIAGNDSHYIDEKGLQERVELMKGKGIEYSDEDSFILDYPDYETFYGRFILQGVFSPKEIEAAIANTLIFDDCEEIDLDHSIKMPTIYPELSLPERVEVLKSEVSRRFDEIRVEEGISGEELSRYKEGIEYEMKIIEDTNDEIHTADYFLFNEKLVNLAVNKYGGVLTRGGRGSCASFYINRILGMTQLDRFKLKLPIFPDRFASTARLLENRSLPDIDFNVKEQEPFFRAAKELLGENGCYPMIAYGTMKLGEAFRNVCRSKGMNFEEYNEVAKNVEQYAEDRYWGPYVQEAKTYTGTIVSISPHPCGACLSEKNILYEYGVVKVGDSFCVMVTSGEADEYKLLKDDFLVVSVWKLIDEAFKAIGQPIMPARELLEAIEDDDAVWNLFRDGITCTLNQVDTDNGMQQARQYGIHSFEDGAFIAAAIRPSFDSWRDQFLKRQPYSTGSKDLDEVLSMTHHYILFQENLMQYFDWLGVSPAESIGLIKKISKKKIKQEDFDALEVRLRENWIKNTGSEDMFDETWQMIQSCISYGFAAPHAAATSLDMCYGAYLKAHYPYEYYCVCFNNYADDLDKTRKLSSELKYFGIRLERVRFRHSRAAYSFDKDAHVIYKGMQSIKYINSVVPEELYMLRDNEYDGFISLLSDIYIKTSANARQIEALIKVGYFEEFGDQAKLLYLFNLYDDYSTRSTIKKDEIDSMGVPEDIVRRHSAVETATRVDAMDYERYLIDKGIPDDRIEEALRECQVVSTRKDPVRGKDKPECKRYSFPKFVRKFSPSEEDMQHYATKVVVGRFQNVDMVAVLREYETRLTLPKCTLQQKLAWQLDYFGYVETIIPGTDKRYVIVTGLDKKYTPRFNAYCIATGESCTFKIHKSRKPGDKFCKTSYRDVPVKDGDMLYIAKCTKRPKMRKTADGYVPIPGEIDWWLNDYRKVSNVRE